MTAMMFTELFARAPALRWHPRAGLGLFRVAGGSLAESRLPVLRAHFERHPTLKDSDYQERFGVTRYTALRKLQRLVDAGFLRMAGERRNAHYMARPALGAREK